jgi:multiple sugar transport system permease protein
VARFAAPAIGARASVLRSLWSGPQQQQARAGVLMVLPAAIFFAIFLIYPVCNAIWVSLTSWDLTSPPRFIGLRNYIELLSDEDVIHSAWVTLYYSAGFLVVTLPIALALAVLLDRNLKGRAFYQSIIFMPVVLSMVVVAMIWRAVLAPNDGLYQLFTVPFGVRGVQWLNDPVLAMPALIVVSAWKSVGYYLVIFLAGLQSIPNTVYEAALLDGAGPWRTFYNITLPLLRPYLLFVSVVSIVRTSQAFGAIFALTGGGPVDATTVLPFLIYQNAFLFNRMGYASAIAVALFLVLVVLTVIQFRLLRSDN